MQSCGSEEELYLDNFHKGGIERVLLFQKKVSVGRRWIRFNFFQSIPRPRTSATPFSKGDEEHSKIISTKVS